MKKTLLVTAGLSALLSANLFAADISVKITNLTKGISFTPLLVSAHPSSSGTFTSGTVASAEIKAMAEGGDISGLVTQLGVSSQFDNNPKGGLLAAGENTTSNIVSLDSANTNLTVLAMMLPTNDGFIALNNIKIPSAAGTYTYYLNGYDAGTEANDELDGSIPGPATGSVGGTGVVDASNVAVASENFVHIHRGTLGDTNNAGGVSDLDSTIHRWLNPVAKVELTVTQ